MSSNIHAALDRFQTVRQGARRFHRQTIGDVDPDYSFGDFLSRVRRNDRTGIEKSYGPECVKNVGAMNEVSGSAGGYTVPPELSDVLMRDISTDSLFRKHGATVFKMTTQQANFPMPDVSTPQAAGISPYFGGMQLSIVPDGDPFGFTAGMQFRNVVLTAYQLGGVVNASNPFLEDSVNLETWLTRLFSRGAAWYQDFYFFAGNGVGKPRGVIGAGGSIAVTRTSTIATDITNMLDNLLPSAWTDGAVWFCHPTVLQKLAASTSTTATWIMNGPLQLHGLPVIPTGQCSTSGTAGDLILAAPSLYIIGDRGEVEVSIGPEEPTAWKNNQSAIRVLTRFDGQPALAAPVTEADGTSLVSPFVVLT
jgi:HK97 family phage major capsid protein